MQVELGCRVGMQVDEYIKTKKQNSSLREWIEIKNSSSNFPGLYNVTCSFKRQGSFLVCDEF